MAAPDTSTPASAPVAIVTGAAGGLGRAITHQLLGDGMRVLAVDHPRSEIEAFGATLGDDASALAVDLTADDAPDRIVATAVDRFGSVQVLVNNAGINRMASVLKTTDEDFDAVVDVNLRAAFRLLRAVVGQMRDQGRDERHVVVNIVSVNGLGAFSGAYGYAASKSGLAGLTRSTARELGPYGIRVNAIAPGLIRTPMTHGPDGLPADWVRTQVEGIPLHRVGEPEDIARVVGFLTSPAAGYVSAQIIRVDGGGLPEI